MQRVRGQRDRCSPAAQLEVVGVSKEVKVARRQPRGAPGNRELARRVSNALDKRDRVREKAPEAFFGSHVRQPRNKLRPERDQAGNHKHTEGIAVEARRPVTPKNIKDKRGEVLREASLIIAR